MNRRALAERFRQWSTPLASALVFFLLWEAGVRLFEVPRYILPPPSRVLTEWIKNTEYIRPHFGVTLYEAAVGLGTAIVVAIPAGLIFSYSKFMRRSFYPLIVFIDEVPKIAFAPLLVTWFGFGLEPKVILTFIVCFFPIFLNSMAGFSSIADEYINLGRSAGAREWEMFWKIRFQSALPQVFVGLKMSASSAMTGAITAEFLAADRGLGLFLQKALSQLNMALGFATIVTMWIIGLSFYYGMTWIEGRAIRWHISRRGGGQEII